MTVTTRTHSRKLKKNLLFWPRKYYAGLTRKQKLERRAEIQKYGAKHWKDPKAYAGFKTDAYGKRKPSQYTQKWRNLFPAAKSLESKAAATGVPLQVIRDCYNRGLAAWRTGHRPGASEEAWGYARAHSLLLCGKTHYGPDADLVRDAKKTKGGRAWFKRCKETNITRKA